MATDPQTHLQKQLILRILHPVLLAKLQSADGGGLQDVQIFREEEQPEPPFAPAVLERMVFQHQQHKLPALLVDLPCPVETHRTFDRVNTYKVGAESIFFFVFAQAAPNDQRSPALVLNITEPS